MKKTTERKEIDSITLCRVQATKDIPRYSIKAGDIGGWVCDQSTFDGDCWVAENSFVIRSVIRSSIILSGCHVTNTSLSNSVIKKESILENSIATNLALTNSKIISSELVSACSRNDDTESIFFDFKSSRIDDCKMSTKEDSDNTRTAIVLRHTSINKSDIEGENIQIHSSGKNLIYELSIFGENIYIESLDKINGLDINGKDIELMKIKKLTDTSVEGNSFKWDGWGKTKVDGSNVYAEPGIINGIMDVKKTRFICKKLQINADNISVSGTTFKKDVDIDGTHVIKNSLFSRGVELSGQTKIENITSTLCKPIIRGNIEIENAKLEGKGIQILDYSKVLGTSKRQIYLGRNVVISELAVISNQASGRAISISEMNVDRDTIITD